MATQPKSAEVIPLIPKDSKSSEKKWGKAVCALGFSVIPSLLFKAQARLGLNPTQLIVLLQLADHWWDSERYPFPGKVTLAERLQMSTRQLQRYIADLERAGFVKRIARHGTHKGRLTNEYDLSGLVEKLKKLEPEFRQVNEMKKQVSRKGGIPQKQQ